MTENADLERLLIQLQADLKTVSRRLDDWKSDTDRRDGVTQATLQAIKNEVQDHRKHADDTYVTHDEFKTPARMVFTFATVMIIGAVTTAWHTLSKLVDTFKGH